MPAMTLPPLPTAVGTVDEGKYLSLEVRGGRARWQSGQCGVAER